jgi:hypothetical protein
MHHAAAEQLRQLQQRNRRRNRRNQRHQQKKAAPLTGGRCQVRHSALQKELAKL